MESEKRASVRAAAETAGLDGRKATIATLIKVQMIQKPSAACPARVVNVLRLLPVPATSWPMPSNFKSSSERSSLDDSEVGDEFNLR